jgi:tricorn protease-like protein
MKILIKSLSFFSLIWILLISFHCSKIDDFLPPIVNIISPLNDYTVSQIVTIQCSAIDNYTVSHVELWVDSINTGIKDYNDPYYLEWYTDRTEHGVNHEIFVRAFDNSSNYADSDILSLTVDNSNLIPDDIELQYINYSNNSFNLKWAKSNNYDFKFYQLSESLDSTMLAENIIYSTEDRLDTTFTVSGISLNEVRYFRITVKYKFGSASQSAIFCGSSFLKILYTAGGDICVMDIYGRNHRKLTQDNDYEGFPDCWKDGSKIVYEKWASVREIWIMDADGSNQRRLTPDTESFSFPKFSPNGKKIVFTSEYVQNTNLYKINTDGTGFHQITNHITLFYMNPSYALNGQTILFSVDNSVARDVYSIKDDGTNLTNITQDTIVAWHTTYSPNGHHIVYEGSKISVQGITDIYIMNSIGSNKRNLTNGQEHNLFPVFSPSGDKIAYKSGTIFTNIFIINIDGTDKRQLTYGNGAHGPCFVPDGSKIVYESHGHIYIMNSDGTSKVNLTSTIGGGGNPTILPVH